MDGEIDPKVLFSFYLLRISPGTSVDYNRLDLHNWWRGRLTGRNPDPFRSSYRPMFNFLHRGLFNKIDSQWEQQLQWELISWATHFFVAVLAQNPFRGYFENLFYRNALRSCSQGTAFVHRGILPIRLLVVLTWCPQLPGDVSWDCKEDMREGEKENAARRGKYIVFARVVHQWDEETNSIFRRVRSVKL